MCDAFFISAFIDELNKIGYDAACVKKAAYVLYHGSPKKLKILAPKNIHGDPDIANAVFATPSREFALPYAGGKWGDRDINQNTQFKKGVRRTIVQEMRPGAFKDIFDGKKGYMYEVPKETFRAPRGRTTWEVISEEKVKPIKVEEIKDVGAALRQAGVTMLPYNSRETLKVLKRRDKRTALMPPDKQRGYLKWWMEKAPPEVMPALKERMKTLEKKAALIGHISGISGSGKTTLAREIGVLYPHLVVKDTDEFLDYAKARYPDMTMDDKVEHVNRLAKAFLKKHKDSPVLLAGGQTKKMDEIVDADKRWMINTGPGLSTWRKYRRLNERPWVGPIGERTESIWDIPKNYIQGWRKRSKIIGRGYQSMSADEIRQRVKDVLEKKASDAKIEFPKGEVKDLAARLGRSKPIYTTRVSAERGRYSSGMSVSSVLGDLKVTGVRHGVGVETHPFLGELSPEHKRAIGNKPYDLVKLEKKASNTKVEKALVAIDLAK